ncbi:MAG: DUF5683 domain-containing protein [Prevotellaceae bacterium]|nr:DUF5683 domain-containing protein [Prevotellaceae bacterium]
MKKIFNILIISLFFAAAGFAQSNDSVVADTLAQKSDFKKKFAFQKKVAADSVSTVHFDTLDNKKMPKPKKIFLPDPNKSMWYGLLFPGGGQIYNRRYWKLPIVYGGFVALAYGISNNGKLYNVYSRAYRDKMDNNPNTDSYLLLNRNNSEIPETTLKNNMNNYRRSRDLCIIGAVAFYAITVVDAFVDAALADFDISPDLSMKIKPTVVPTQENSMTLAMSLQFNF